jgi:hypothetical protein
MSRTKVCLSETVARQRRAAQFLKNQAARARRKALAALRTTHASHDPVGMASNAAASSPGLTASAAHRIAATADLMALSRDRERLSNLLKNAAASVGAEAARAAAERAARAAAARAKAEAASAKAALETKRVAAAVATAQLTMHGDAAGVALAAAVTPDVIEQLLSRGYAAVDGGPLLQTLIASAAAAEKEGLLAGPPQGLTIGEVSVLRGRSMRDDTSPVVLDAFLRATAPAATNVLTKMLGAEALAATGRWGLSASVRDLRATQLCQPWHRDSLCTTCVTFIILLERHTSVRTAILAGSHIGGVGGAGGPGWELCEWGAGLEAGSVAIMLGQPLHCGAGVAAGDEGKRAMYVAVSPTDRKRNKHTRNDSARSVTEGITRATEGTKYASSAAGAVVFHTQPPNAAT